MQYIQYHNSNIRADNQLQARSDELSSLSSSHQSLLCPATLPLAESSSSISFCRPSITVNHIHFQLAQTSIAVRIRIPNTGSLNVTDYHSMN